MPKKKSKMFLTFSTKERSTLSVVFAELAKKRPDLFVKLPESTSEEMMFEVTPEGDLAIAKIFISGSVSDESEVIALRNKIISYISCDTGLELEECPSNDPHKRSPHNPNWRPAMSWSMSKDYTYGSFEVKIYTNHAPFVPDSCSVSIIDPSGKEYDFDCKSLPNFAEKFRAWFRKPEIQAARCINPPEKKVRKKAAVA